MNVIKRDGRKVEFSKQKIKEAILKAFISIDGTISPYATHKAENIADFIEQESKIKELSIEEIQDMVEKGLMSTKRKDVARAYISYRNTRNEVRNKNSMLRRNIREKLFAKNVQNQNANLDEKSFGGRMGEAGGVLFKDIALMDGYISEMAKNNHLNNEIYIHDLDHYAVGDHNCLSIPFDDLLAKGFNTRQTDVRPAQSINTAFQLVAVIFQLQSLQQFGGVSATHLDWTMVPYVRKSFWKHFKDGLKYINKDNSAEKVSFDPNLSIEDEIYKASGAAYDYAIDMTTKEAYQAVEGMYHNL